ncbi:ribose-phosphate diphosphokinase [Candidatus Woesearchaeota archaeon]|nr:ribose-phosphate diphosphokinase [Candidatus Woesearchaeota archaeon]MBW3016331.1 ribose-phosphate diphosphokinase [Candidatus Woesearchaeota archaeon]
MIIGVGTARKFGRSVVSRFKDGELYVKVPKLKSATVVAGFTPPADNFLELVFVLDALKRLKAKVNLIITYFGYARQDFPVVGEAGSAEVVARILKSYVKNIVVFDLHSSKVQRFLKCKNIIPVKLFLPFVPKDVVLVAPDEGAVPRARLWQRFLRVPVVCLRKRRVSGRVEIVGMEGSVKGKNVLIVDDMIAAGSTVVETAKLLKKSGAKDIFVAVTHGLFCDGALSKLSKANIKKVFVTDSLPQKKHRLLKVVSVKGLLG